MPQHQRGEAVAPVGRHLPAHARAAVAVHEHERQRVSVGGHLEVHKGVIHAGALARLDLLGPAYEAGIIVRALALQGGAADGEVPLSGYRERLLRHGPEGDEGGKEKGGEAFHCHLPIDVFLRFGRVTVALEDDLVERRVDLAHLVGRIGDVGGG